MKKIGVFFGSFDPIHIGHLNVATSVINSKLVDEVVMVVAYSNPWKEKQTPFYDRVAMAEIACSNILNVKVSPIEELVKVQDGDTYTYKVLRTLKEQNSDAELYIITTQETYAEMTKWEHGDEIIHNNNFIITLSKHFETITFTPNDNCKLLEIADIPLSSSMVRDMINKHLCVIPYVLPQVNDYIEAKKLYGSISSTVE